MRLRRFAYILSSFVVTVGLYVLAKHTMLHRINVQLEKLINKPKILSPYPPTYVAVVACGQRFAETLVMIKSALLFHRSKNKLHFLIFAEDQLMIRFKEKLIDWRAIASNAFDFELLPLQFPPTTEKEWRNLFKPCAAQRLFFPSILQTIDALLYVDTDIIFVSPVADIWSFFGKFNSSQIVALSPEHEDANIGWYNRFARHPYYGKLGVNSGVMLMNLTRMREFNWESHVLPIHKEYKYKITWGDQDILNILFYYYPEKLFVMPCEYNYRPDHCMYVNFCNTSAKGIKIMHGNRGYFHSNKQPLFRIIYEAMESYRYGSEPYHNFLHPLKHLLQDSAVVDTNCGKVWKDALIYANRTFVDRNYTLVPNV